MLFVLPFIIVLALLYLNNNLNKIEEKLIQKVSSPSEVAFEFFDIRR